MDHQGSSVGVGLGLRFEFLEDLLGAGDHEDGSKGLPQFLELSPENYMRRGGYIPQMLEQIASRYPLRSHGLSMSLGDFERLDAGYLGELRHFLDRWSISSHSDHLSSCGLQGSSFHDLLPVSFTAKSAQRIAAKIREASDRLERSVTVENISYYVALGAPAADEPAFINEVLAAADCGLLLDLNNLYVNAHNHGFDVWKWLEQIPLNRVVELHLAGPEAEDDGFLIDTHGAPVRPLVYDMLSWVVSRVGPLPVVLERDHNLPELPALLSEVGQIKEAYERSLRVWEQKASRSDAA